MKAVKTMSVGITSIHQASCRCVLPKRSSALRVEESATLLLTPADYKQNNWRRSVLQKQFRDSPLVRPIARQSRCTVSGEKAGKQTETYSAPSGVEY